MLCVQNVLILLHVQDFHAIIKLKTFEAFSVEVCLHNIFFIYIYYILFIIYLFIFFIIVLSFNHILCCMTVMFKVPSWKQWLGLCQMLSLSLHWFWTSHSPVREQTQHLKITQRHLVVAAYHRILTSFCFALSLPWQQKCPESPSILWKRIRDPLGRILQPCLASVSWSLAEIQISDI